jgi:hypothetical protein
MNMDDIIHTEDSRYGRKNSYNPKTITPAPNGGRKFNFEIPTEKNPDPKDAGPHESFDIQPQGPENMPPTIGVDSNEILTGKHALARQSEPVSAE